MTATLAPTAPTQRGKVRAISLGALVAAIPPLAFYFLPPIQRTGEGIINFFAHSGSVSYSPEHPVEPLPSDVGGLASMGTMLFLILASAGFSFLIATALYFTLIKPLHPGKKNEERIAFSIASIGGGIGAGAVLILFLAVVAPHSEATVIEREEPAHIAQWAEDRYGLSLNETDAEALVDQAHDDGDPVLIEGHLLNLTRIAQGGYVLTDDKSATELPVEH